MTSTSVNMGSGQDMGNEGGSDSQRKRLLGDLYSLIDQAPKNGIDTPPSLDEKIQETCQQLQALSPNPRPCEENVELLDGFWYMLWTNYAPAGPSSGKLGPFVGNVYQELRMLSTASDSSIARNIFRLGFPPIMGELQASPRIHDERTVAIAFERVGTKVAGVLPLGPNINFEPGKEVRLWEHVYVDEKHRILYASNAADPTDPAEPNPKYLYVMKRADSDQFSTDIF